jgi:hypothetical protein
METIKRFHFQLLKERIEAKPKMFIQVILA